MIRSTTRIKIHKLFKKKGKKLFRKLDISKLKNVEIGNELETNLNEQLTQTDKTVEDKCSSFRYTVYRTSSEVLGCVTRRHKNWFDEISNGMELLINYRIPYTPSSVRNHVELADQS